MKKIIVVGSPGAGKSCLSRHLRDKLGYPLFYLDCMFWKENWEHISRPELIQKLEDIFQLEEWIIDGNYNGTMELRLQNCDTVIFLDIPVEECIASERERRGKKREDLPEFLEEKEDPSFVEFIRSFPKETKPLILELAEKYKDKKFFHFTSREAAHSFVDEL